MILAKIPGANSARVIGSEIDNQKWNREIVKLEIASEIIMTRNENRANREICLRITRRRSERAFRALWRILRPIAHFARWAHLAQYGAFLMRIANCSKQLRRMNSF